ncbi:hypothetical protein [Gracilibacillus orientalis]|uniref:hypothetical protein n=1 Tax=Gracilibacillus orientalis TaxID=334253 RepID=UPI0011138EAA|nr:hypothetical protein [Gracilibacillus orientalis]
MASFLTWLANIIQVFLTISAQLRKNATLKIPQEAFHTERERFSAAMVYHSFTKEWIQASLNREFSLLRTIYFGLISIDPSLFFLFKHRHA